MTYAYVFPFCIEADTAFRNFTNEVRLNKAVRLSCGGVAVIEDDEYVFLGQSAYDKWKMGRTYMLDGILYHSGFEIRERSEPDELVE